MRAGTVTGIPFSFPARDGYALRGTVFTRRSTGEPIPEEPSGASTSNEAGYVHPFVASTADFGSDDADLDDSEPTLPFGRNGDDDPLTHWDTRDGTEPPDSRGVVIINGATAVPHKFYGRFAAALAEGGYTTVTYDYRGVGGSRSRDLRTLDADMSDWAFLDMAAAVDWATKHYPTDRLFLVGHSFGGQVAGMLDNADAVRGMATFCSQSGYWKLQGDEQRWYVGLHVHASMPILSRVVGYAPMHRLGAGEDIPKGVALQWSSWCRDPDYLFGDSSLPLERFEQFDVPVVAYSFDDDKWGTKEAVDDLMLRAYPNVERRHVVPVEHGISEIGHMGYFKEQGRSLWPELVQWLDAN